MIQFPCHGCGQVFSVADDEAGRPIQCRTCGRLTDVPTHTDLNGLSDDGTIKLVDANHPIEDPSERLADITLAFQKSRVDEHGDQIDLRNSPEELAVIGEPNDPEATRRARYKPQYDPETGELVRPLDVRPDPRDVKPASIPFAAPAPVQHAPVISYAPLRDPEMRRHTLFQRLLEPANVAVTAFVLFGLGFGYFLQLLLGAILDQVVDGIHPSVLWPLNFMFWLAAAHFGNTILATGPEEHDELPRPLQSLMFWEDILGPMVKVLGAALLCYAPMLAALAVLSGRARLIALPLMVIGGYFFPAVVLTAVTSGSVLNLQPRRLGRVIRVAGARYFPLAVGWIIVFPVYVWSTTSANLIFSSLGIDPGRQKAGELLLAIPLAAISVFVIHYFCWQLGLLFRSGHERFGWVWEELVRQREEERKQRGAMSAADRAAMRRQRQLRAAAEGRSHTYGPERR